MLLQAPPRLSKLSSVDFVVDCTVEGLLHAPELPEILLMAPEY